MGVKSSQGTWPLIKQTFFLRAWTASPRLCWWRESERCWEETHHSGDWVTLLVSLFFWNWCSKQNCAWKNNHFLICHGLSGAGVVSCLSRNYLPTYLGILLPLNTYYDESWLLEMQNTANGKSIKAHFDIKRRSNPHYEVTPSDRVRKTWLFEETTNCFDWLYWPVNCKYTKAWYQIFLNEVSQVGRARNSPL